MLYLIGLGLAYPSDITVRGLQKVQQSKKVYLEHYTSILMNASLEELCEFYGKEEVILADREMVEGGCEEMIEASLTEDVSFLVVGDVFGATTHTDLILRCKQRNVPFEVIHNASVGYNYTTLGKLFLWFSSLIPGNQTHGTTRSWKIERLVYILWFY